jgi:hypothetical protein
LKQVEPHAAFPLDCTFGKSMDSSALIKPIFAIGTLKISLSSERRSRGVVLGLLLGVDRVNILIWFYATGNASDEDHR